VRAPHESDVLPLTGRLNRGLLFWRSQVEAVKGLLKVHRELLYLALSEEFATLMFSHAKDPNSDVEKVKVDVVCFDKDFSVVGLAGSECTVAFRAKVNYSAYVCYDDPNTIFMDPSGKTHRTSYQFEGMVYDSAKVSGTAKLVLNSKWDKLERISLLSLDTPEIVVTATPEI